MEKILIVYVHLIATCMAIGVIVITDLRLLAKVVGYKVVIPPPERFETAMISIALVVLCLSGAGVVGLGLAADPNYLANPKLQAKLVLVGLLCLNAVLLHRVTFPRLARGRPVASWTLQDRLSVAVPVAISNSLWMYCAFLGIARPWNHVKPIGEVLAPAAVLFIVLLAGVLAVLKIASRDEPLSRPDWIDSMKARLSDRGGLGGYRHSFERGAPDTVI